MPMTQTISTKELRENFDFVKSMLASGQSLTLIYRSQPIAQIKPVQASSYFPRQNVKQLAGGVKLKTQLTPNKLNKLYDQTYKL
jgi:antitoxin (DNA-binding transcriptional repressor) of toxin-antitoxin stability system